MTLNQKKILRRVLPIVIGGFAGYAYYYFIGCNNGCAIQSNPFASKIYVQQSGILSFPSKNKTILVTPGNFLL
jgi:hypothetical protein